MKTAPCILIWWLLSAALLHAADDDFAARFRKAKSSHDAAQAAAILDEWKAARPNDPEYYIAAANDLLDHHSGVVISTRKAGPGDLVVADQKTGQEVGSVAADPQLPSANQQAVELLKRGVAKAPERMDIYLGLATLYERLDDSAALLADLTAMAAYANAHADEVLGRGGKPYPAPVDQNLSRQISDIASRYYARGTKAGNQTFHDLARMDIESFSNAEYGYNLMGFYYSAIEDNPKLALAYYVHAAKLAPKDSLVWINVGLAHGLLGEKPEAVEAFRRVVELNNDADCVRQAKAQLAKLK